MNYKLEKPVQGVIGTEKYSCSIDRRNRKFIADEPEKTEEKMLVLIHIRFCDDE